jgi:hypothetical protein
MQTKIVYVLVSNDSDTYLEQALLSMCSLRIHNPDTEIILIVDDLTDATITGKRSNILKYITSKVVVNIQGKYTNLQRSRILKTSMIEYIEGDFLYIDNDTIITSSLAEIDNFSYDVGAIRELHLPSFRSHYDFVKIKKDIKKIGGEINYDSKYFNAGVIFVRDNHKTRQFFKDWNEYWLKGSLSGINLDMPSFAIADILNNHIIQELSGVWNCQIYWGLKYLYQSKIIHYLVSNMPFHTGSLSDFIDEKIWLDIKREGEISEKINYILNNPYEYFSEYTQIIYGHDVKIWNSFSVRLLRFLYRTHTKLFKIINWVCRYIFEIRK